MPRDIGEIRLPRFFISMTFIAALSGGPMSATAAPSDDATDTFPAPVIITAPTTGSTSQPAQNPGQHIRHRHHHYTGSNGSSGTASGASSAGAGSAAAAASAFRRNRVNGTCGASNGQKLSSKPTTNLCSAGTASAVSGTGPWKWSCAGSNGGSTAQCTASLKPVAVNGACGASNGQTLSSKPTANLCTTGTASAVSGTGPWKWSCAGSNGGNTAQCMASLKPVTVNGACGTADGMSMSSAPTTNLCTSGTASAISGSGPWSWSCAGSNGGSTAQCMASITSTTVNGACGSANGQTFSSAPTASLCSVGTATALTVDGSAWIWQCAGTAGGDVAGCIAYQSSGGSSCATTPTGTSGTFDPNNPAASGMQLTFDDEFNTLSAAEPPGQDSTWETNFYYNTPEPCDYDESPYSLNDGVLDMNVSTTSAAMKACGISYPYTTYPVGHLDTYHSFAQQYGYFETRAQASDVYGTIFAFWMLPESGAWPPEIDAPEILGNSPSLDFVTNHSGKGQSQFYPTEPDLSRAFHTYGVLWNASNITWYLDGKIVGSVPTGADEHVPFYMILEFSTGSCGDGWADCPQNPTSLNANAYVDWVHVWGLPSYGNPAVLPQSGFTGGNGSCAE